MNRTEGAALLRAYLEPYRRQSHAELQQLLQAPVADEVDGPSGKRYQVQIQAAWTGAPGGELRVVGGIDDSGWQTFTPLVESFTVAPPAAEPAPAGASQ